MFYRDNGYFQARTTEHTVDIVDVGGGKFKLPLIRPNRVGKKANIAINIEVDEKIKLIFVPISSLIIYLQINSH